MEVEHVDFISIVSQDIDRFFRDPDGNALMLHRRYAPE